MATYAIGDLQGCFRELHDLLELVEFDEAMDRLWFTGDLVNRGPESLECLRFVEQLGERAVATLGNHDLHLLAIAAGRVSPRKKDTLAPILEAADRELLLDWLRCRPLLHRDTALGYTLIHAGLPPQWTLDTAAALAAEAETCLRGAEHDAFFAHMYGDKPDLWDDDLKGWDRLRFIINSFTRMRYCDAAGRMNLEDKGPPGTQPDPWLPWYAVPGRRSAGERIVFGHWSTVALGKAPRFDAAGVFPLDTGCVWGGQLTALRLDDGTPFSVPSRQPRKFPR